ncbi:3'(2'),5'-bisphosphate nucleotidase CysQ [Shimia aestuarii]|uniref:3'(2'),5'-bisphosphate nucleotidase CysQ n=1 Tax=Shimia aestuarii TaxID=254406 RepID=UPI001FB1EEFB|nr:3'(2'),5'-bisphosphate nucleotidase CysQ [Shimia aestuarii]
MPASDDLTLLIEAAREAGKIALRYTGPEARVWDKPGGAGPVTEADLAVNAMLERELQAARPSYGWLSEETEDNADRLGREQVFIVDPLDGTRSFMEGARTWAHALATVAHGEVQAAVIYLPMMDKLYSAAKGAGAFLNGEPIAPSSRDSLLGASILAARPALAPEHWRRVPDIKRSHRPSLAYRTALVAEGRYDAMLTLRPTWEWDIAAGDLILREAGAATSDRYGARLRFNNADPRQMGMVAAPRALHENLTGALAPKGAVPRF